MLARSFIFTKLLAVFTIGFLLAMFNIRCSSSDGNSENVTHSRSDSPLYHQDLDIGGDPNTAFDGAISYIEPSTGSLLQVFLTKVGKPWYMGQSRYSWIGDLRLEAELIPGNDISGEPTRIVRLISPYFNRFLVDVLELHGPNNFTRWRKLTEGPVENGNPVSEPYSDREKKFYGTVDISCYYVPGEELDYCNEFLPPLFDRYEDVIDRWVLGDWDVIEPGVFRWSASVGVLTEDPTPIVMDTLPPGPYEITYEGRHITVRGDGSANGLRVKVGDVSFVADYAPAPVSHWAPQWDMRVYGDHQGRPVAELFFSWLDEDKLLSGGTYNLHEIVRFDGVLLNPETDTCYAFAHTPSLAGEGKITFLRLALAPEGMVAVFVQWTGFAREADLEYCMGPASETTPLYGDPIPASVYGLFWTKNCCVWRDEQTEPDQE